MGKKITAGRVEIDVLARVDQLDKGFREAEKKAEQAGRKVGDGFARGMGRKGDEAAKRWVQGLERVFDRDAKKAREALFRGLIDEKEYERRAAHAADRFNKGLIRGLDKLRLEGKVSDRMERELVGGLKRAGLRAGDEFGDGVEKGARPGFDRLATWIRRGFQVLVAGAIVHTLREVAQGVANLVDRGGKVNQIALSFQNLAASVNESAESILGGMRRAMRGTVADVNLMTQANVAMQSGLPATAENLERLAYVSRRLALAMGRDATDGFQRLTNGIAKGEQQILEELGIMARMETTLRKWEIQTGKNSDALTQQQKILLFYNEVMAEAEAKVAALGAESTDAGTRLAQLSVQWENLLDKTTGFIVTSPTLTSMLEGIGFGASDSADEIELLAAKIAAFVETVLQAKEILGNVTLANPADWSGAYDRNLRRILDDANAQTRVQEVRAETDINRLMERRLEIQTELAKGMALTTKEDEKRYNQLREEDRAILRRLNALKNPPPPAGGGTGGSDLKQGEITKMENALQKLQDRIAEVRLYAGNGIPLFEEPPKELPAALKEILQLDREILQIEEEIKAARGKAPAEAREVLVAYREQRDAVKASVAGMHTELAKLDQVKPKLAGLTNMMTTGFLAVTAKGVTPMVGAMDKMTAATKATAAAQRELVAAQIEGDAGGVAAAKEKIVAAEKAAAKAARETMAVLRAGLKQGAIDQAKFNQLIAEMAKLLKEAGVEVEKVAEPRSWEDTLKTVEGLARGVLSVADAMGILDEETRQALDGMVNLASAGARLIESKGTDIGAWAQGIGSAIQIGQALFGASPEEEAARAKQRAAMKELTAALYALRDAYLGNVSTADLESDLALAGGMRGAIKTAAGSETARLTSFTQAALSRQLGLASADSTDAEANAAIEARFAELDARYGTNLVELLKQGYAKDIIAAFEQLTPEIQAQIEKLGGFDDSVGGILERVAFQMDILGKTDAAERLRAVNDALKAAGKNLGQFADEFDELAGLDLSTEAGQKRRDEIVRQMMEESVAGGANFGDLTVEQFRELLEQWAKATGGAPGEDGGATSSFQVTRSITEVTGNRLVGWLATIAYWTEQIARAAGAGQGIAASPMPQADGSLPSASLAGPSMPSGGTSEVIVPGAGDVQPAGLSIGVVQVTIQATGGVTPENAGAIGREVGQRAVEEIDRGLGAKTIDRYRGAGRPTGWAQPR